MLSPGTWVGEQVYRGARLTALGVSYSSRKMISGDGTRINRLLLVFLQIDCSIHIGRKSQGVGSVRP